MPELAKRICLSLTPYEAESSCHPVRSAASLKSLTRYKEEPMILGNPKRIDFHALLEDTIRCDSCLELIEGAAVNAYVENECSDTDLGTWHRECEP